MAKSTQKLYGDPYIPSSVADDGLVGFSPETRRLLDLIDTTDSRFPAIASVLSDMVAAGVELDESTIAIAIKMGKSKASRKPERERVADTGLPMWSDDGDQTSIVYYIRQGAHIKIGTTTRPHLRFASLAPEEILGFEPGDRTIESLRHQQFAHLRRGCSEYFRRGKDLTKHIRQIRKIHGDPDSSWRSLANSEKRGHRLPRTLPAPVSSEVVTAAEASRAAGVALSTVSRWVSRGQLPSAGRNPKGRPVYYLDHVRALADKSLARREARAMGNT